jgi:hypothetical protein
LSLVAGVESYSLRAADQRARSGSAKQEKHRGNFQAVPGDAGEYRDRTAKQILEHSRRAQPLPRRERRHAGSACFRQVRHDAPGEAIVGDVVGAVDASCVAQHVIQPIVAWSISGDQGDR